MSTVKERADVEAAIAEAELTEEEAAVVWGGIEQDVPYQEAIALVKEARDSTDTEPAGTDTGDSGLTPEQMKELDKAKAAYERKVRQLLGDLADGLVTCEECSGFGLAEAKADTIEPKAHEWFIECETCGGLGQVLTGSKVPGNALRQCPACVGRGYLEALDPTGAPRAAQPGTTPTAPIVAPADGLGNGETATGELPAGGSFGTPAWMGDPNLGR